jgi:hypothetical protein
MRGYRDTVIYQNHRHGDTFIYFYYLEKMQKNKVFYQQLIVGMHFQKVDTIVFELEPPIQVLLDDTDARV